VGLPIPSPEDSWDEIPTNETTAIYGHTAIRVMTVGDAGVGKSTMINTFASSMGIKVNDDTPFRMISVPDVSLSVPSMLNLVDTQAGDRVAKFRTLNYQGSHAILLTFAVNNRTSFENIKNEWMDEIEFYSPKVPIILIGAKCDQRTDDESSISTEEAKQLAWDMKAAGYYEVTSTDPRSLSTVFTAVTKLICRLRAAMVQRAIDASAQRQQTESNDEELEATSTSPIVQKIFHRIKSSQNFLRSSLRLR